MNSLTPKEIDEILALTEAEMEALLIEEGLDPSQEIKKAEYILSGQYLQEQQQLIYSMAYVMNHVCDFQSANSEPIDLRILACHKLSQAVVQSIQER